MTTRFIEVTPHDPLVARDGRPFGVNQGQRMRGLPWLLPSVVAGSFRTALVKADSTLDFSGDVPLRLLAIDVAGVFPVHAGQLYLPAPNDALGEPDGTGNQLKTLHRLVPQPNTGGCDFPDDLPLRPLMLPSGIGDFKPADLPAWWPIAKYTQWLLATASRLPDSWFSGPFLNAAHQELRDHVCLDAQRGASAEGMIYATAGLHAGYLPRFGVKLDDRELSLDERFAKISLTARVRIPESERGFQHVDRLDLWHPLGGERRLVHWHHNGAANVWTCPKDIRNALGSASQIRMILATPAIFQEGWKPGWLNAQLEGSPPGSTVKLRLVGVSNGRWQAVSGWSLAPPRGPKPVRRMVPAGSVYFFERIDDHSATLADSWLQSVSDDGQEQRDGFGLAVWGIW